MNTSGHRAPHDTPCRGICTATSLGDAVCKGCGRTQQEVQEWNGYTKEQKIEINQRLRNNQCSYQR